MANDLGMTLKICHFPPGTTKWNKIEHRLFCFITKNWRGRPLTTYEVIVNLIASTTTKTGLIVRAALDPRQYETGITVSDEELEHLRLTRAKFHGGMELHYQAARLKLVKVICSPCLTLRMGIGRMRPFVIATYNCRSKHMMN